MLFVVSAFESWSEGALSPLVDVIGLAAPPDVELAEGVVKNTVREAGPS